MGRVLKQDLLIVAGMPLVFLAALRFLPMFGMLAWALGTTPHELGHTFAAWLCSLWASPTMFFTVTPSEERQWWFFGAQIIGCALIFRQGRRWGSSLLTFLPGLYVMLLLFCTFMLRHNSQQQLILWSGLGGELLLSAAIVAIGLAYGGTLPWVEVHYRALFFWGGLVFTNNVRRWYLAQTDPTQIPFGAFGENGGDGDASNGDVDRLLNQYHWTLDELTRSYLRAGAACWVFLGIVALIAIATRKTESES